LSGAFYVLQALVPLMREGGSIVTVASVAAQTGTLHHPHYAAAKAGLAKLRQELGAGIGASDSCELGELYCTRYHVDSYGTKHHRITSSGLCRDKDSVQRYASAEEIARCIVFVASPIAGFMTGATVDINGGREMR
jgi:3-oxoacyl-[acyl-carrier protein] reductase